MLPPRRYVFFCFVAGLPLVFLPHRLPLAGLALVMRTLFVVRALDAEAADLAAFGIVLFGDVHLFSVV